MEKASCEMSRKNFLTPRQNYQRSTPHERGHRGESSSLSSKIELLVVRRSLAPTLVFELENEPRPGFRKTQFVLGVRN